MVDPWAGLMAAKEIQEHSKLKVLLSGGSGAGKTTAASRCGRMLYVPTELQGIPTIQDNNPDALIWCNTEDYDEPRPGVRDYRDLGRLGVFLMNADLSRVDWVVVDGISDLQEIIIKYRTRAQTSGRETTDLDTWGLIKNDTLRFCRVLRDLPVNVMMTALDQERESDDKVAHRPALAGKGMGDKIAQYFNLVGYAHKERVTDGVRWSVLFKSGSKYLTKTARGINTMEAPEPRLWAAKRFGLEVPEDVAERAEAWAKQS